MSSTTGYVIISQAINPVRVKDAAEAINNDLKVAHRRDKFSEYVVLPAGDIVCEDFIEVGSSSTIKVWRLYIL